MKRFAINFSVLIITAVLVVQLFKPVTGQEIIEPIPAPEFTHMTPDEWINSEPLRLVDLKGKVILVDFWTFDCWNCYRSFPWLNALEMRLEGEDFLVIGVHTPEFSHERIRKNIETKVKEFNLHHPVMIDNDFSYWKAMHNKYWPAFYLFDKQGRIRAVFYGETHKGDRQAEKIEDTIKALLQEQT